MHAIALTAKVSRDDLAKAKCQYERCLLAALALLDRFEFKQPRLRHSYTRLDADAVPMTRAPICLAICVAAMPTPPPAECTRTVSPRFNPPMTTTSCHAVK